jgi:hypothetical protein
LASKEELLNPYKTLQSVLSEFLVRFYFFARYQLSLCYGKVLPYYVLLI